MGLLQAVDKSVRPKCAKNPRLASRWRLSQSITTFSFEDLIKTKQFGVVPILE